VNRRFVPAPPATIFSVLGDGHSYERWVVGTSTILSVDRDWPLPGAKLRYRLGRGSASKDDETRAVRFRPGELLELEAVGKPFGTVTIEFWVDEVHGGSLITLIEHPNKGLAKVVHNKAFDLLIWLRNIETLRRLGREVTAP
jgi:uncharacterized protein YndB with AHSA1/START domain